MRVSTPEYPLIDADALRNFGAINQYEANRGSVLYSTKWSVLMNDLFVSGAIANRVPFYLASNRKLDTLWEPGSSHSTLFAREMAGLFMSGYEIIRLADGSEAMIPPQNRTNWLKLTKYMRQLPAYSSRVSVEAMAQPNLIKLLYNSRAKKLISVRFSL